MLFRSRKQISLNVYNDAYIINGERISTAIFNSFLCNHETLKFVRNPKTHHKTLRRIRLQSRKPESWTKIESERHNIKPQKSKLVRDRNKTETRKYNPKIVSKRENRRSTNLITAWISRRNPGENHRENLREERE